MTNTNLTALDTERIPIPQDFLWAVLLICGLILVGALIWVFIAKQKPDETYKERILVALLFFATSLIIGLLFGIDAKLESEDPSTKFMFIVGGPFAASLIGLFVYWKIVIPASAKIPLNQALASIISASQELERRINALDTDLVRFVAEACARVQADQKFIDYETWRNSCDYPNIAKADFVLRNLLEVAFNPFARHKLTEVKVSSIFIYLDDRDEKDGIVYKFERVQGKTQENKQCCLRLRSTSSFGSGKVTSIMMQAAKLVPFSLRRDVSDRDDAGSLAEGYLDVTNENVDCLTITRYTDSPEDADYVMVAASRFTSETTIHLRCAVGSRKRFVTEDKAYEVRASLVPFKSGAIPLIFREFKEERAVDAKGVWEEIKPWILGLATKERELKSPRSMEFWQIAKKELGIVNTNQLGIFHNLDLARFRAVEGQVSNITLFLFSLKNDAEHLIK